MTDLQKRIEELREELKKQVSDYETLAKDFADLEEEREKYKLLWESACEGAKAIIAEQEKEIKVLKQKLLKMRGNNDK